MSDETENTGRIQRLETAISEIHSTVNEINNSLSVIRIKLLGSEADRIKGIVDEIDLIEHNVEALRNEVDELVIFKKTLTAKILAFSAGGAAAGAGGVWAVIKNFLM